MTDLIEDATTRADAGSALSRWRLGEAFLLRVAGQSADVTAALRTEKAAAWVQRVFDLEAARDTAGAALRAELEAAVAATDEDDPGRAALINLRRDVYNSRRPRPATVTKARAVLDPAREELLSRWADSVTALRDELENGTAILADDVTEARSRARVLLADDDLRCAVLLQSEVLESTMDRYLDPKRKLDKAGRQIERTLLELLYRAALKTSPFSTLTSVGLGRFSPDTRRARPDPESLQQHSAARLNVAVPARLAAVILADPQLRSDIHVSTAPGAGLDGESMRYVRRRTTAGTDPDAVVAIDSVHEDLFFLPSGPALADVVAYAGGDTRPSLHELARQVAAAGEGREVGEVDQLLGHLLRLGFLLAPDLQIDLRSTDPAGVFAAALATHDHPTLQAVAGRLAAADGLVQEYPSTPARARAGVLAQIREHIRACFDAVGAPRELVPRTLVYEDTTIADGGLDVDARLWEQTVLPDLADLADLLPAFDLNVSRRLTANGFFRARYGVGGRCEDVVRFCHEFQRDFFEPYTQRSMRRRPFDDDNAFVRQENWFKLADIDAVDDAREAASAELRARCAGTSGTPDEVRLDDGFVDAVRRHLPAGSRLHQPWSFFVQLARDDAAAGPGRMVLNQAYAGLTLMFSRFAHSLDANGGRAEQLIRRTLRDYTPAGAVLAELRGGYETTNLNIHPDVTDYEIVCPGDASTRPPDEQIPLDDLVLEHDADADRVRLRSVRLDREVVPVYLGFLMPMALPEIQQVLMCFSPTGMAQIDLWAGTGEPVPDEGITMYPRLVLGDLVLQRRMWKMNVAALPVRDPADSDAEHLLRVQRWRRENGLPARVFAQVDTAAARSADDGAEADDDPAPGAGGDPGAGGERKTGRKPLPVDFDSWLSLHLFEQMVLGASNRIVLTEPDPDVDQLWLHDQHGRPYVGELLIELYDRPDSADRRDDHVR
ncbi:lantibiotic biosynthesis dehydratase-like protein [Haloactinopolyspora alba]|uniref:Lantibiotic biosynthesis dehydratase-like protein n=1 Tax=Haloactinopolyspora alba TaxID=648780 RepID=A0A2P8DWN9_9ACTN|nr:lantibiotic dehydratase [Haloactinopolyspora alba]PSL01622.1 lantibiotic biosynthesis dehydratase-like protein [Haloactinopolyspora alba]